MNIKNVGRNQALKSEAFRESRHVDPTRVINFRAHNHASFIFIFQSIGLLCTVSIPIYLKIRIFIRLKKKTEQKKNTLFIPKHEKMEPIERRAHNLRKHDRMSYEPMAASVSIEFTRFVQRLETLFIKGQRGVQGLFLFIRWLNW